MWKMAGNPAEISAEMPRKAMMNIFHFPVFPAIFLHDLWVF